MVCGYKCKYVTQLQLCWQKTSSNHVNDELRTNESSSAFRATFFYFCVTGKIPHANIQRLNEVKRATSWAKHLFLHIPNEFTLHSTVANAQHCKRYKKYIYLSSELSSQQYGWKFLNKLIYHQFTMSMQLYIYNLVTYYVSHFITL